MDDMINSRNIETSRGNIRREKNRIRDGFESGQVSFRAHRAAEEMFTYRDSSGAVVARVGNVMGRL
jgi:hypothetical protein